MNPTPPTSSRMWVAALLWFNAISAITGGLAVATSSLSLPASWLANSLFSSYEVPGLILMVIVGGSSLVAALSATLNKRQWPLLTLGAGLIMTGWIAGEVVIINQFSWLQITYLLSGAILIMASWVRLKIAPKPG